ncbi:DUF3592 domain-containing protein [Flavisphingomonas formosensis]|uniref:DUF3592 domain-containing protein n=1 Tax=Flavisphingomonas formosensis TaxID=861534 RepID=UPI0012FB204C|nr:DUF3592 domain-containing protein [Sphingomonas formosensis]
MGIGSSVAYWLNLPWLGPAVFGVLGFAGVLLGVIRLAQQRLLQHSASRMETAPGLVREAQLLEWTEKGTRRAAIVLKVDFEAGGESYVCDQWELFRGSMKLEHGGVLPEIEAGDTVPVWYDPDDPAVAALAIGRPSYVSVLAAFGAAAFFVLLTWGTWP